MMQNFQWVDARTVDEAATLLAGSVAASPIVAKAGGIDVLDLMKEGILAPTTIVNLKSIAGLDRIGFSSSDGLEIGALATLNNIAASTEVRTRYPALADAVSRASTPQIRRAATMGGNLLQRPRCWYFRNAVFHHVEDVHAYVREGENQYHAIFDNARTALVHASTPATALTAYDARVELRGPHDRHRIIPLRDFLLPPEPLRDNDTMLERGEVLTRVLLPPPAPGTRAAYHKQTERESYDWPICDVAVVLTMDGETVTSAAIAMGWVAPTPRRATSSEEMLVGHTLSEHLARSAARAAVADATPLSKNAYKVTVLEAVVRRTILKAVAGA
jgi:xanthine dehydrogenase YagS FAD-binding subunit